MKHSIQIITTVVGLSLAVTGSALANIRTATYVGDSSVWGNLGGGGMSGMGNYYVGVSEFTQGSGANTSTFYGFCIDLQQLISPGTYTFDERALTGTPIESGGANPWAMNAGQATKLSELWGRYYGQVVGANNTVLDAHKAAAFQTAVWEIVYQTTGSLDVKTGWNQSKQQGFQITTPSGGGWSVADANLANSWIASLNGTGPMATLITLASTTTQDFIIAGVGAPVVPVPSSVVLLLVGLVLIGIVKRRLA